MAEEENEEMKLTKEEIEDYKKAGKILKEVLDSWKQKIKPGMKLLDIAEQMEKQIIDLGGKPAFPVNLSRNNFAAHYTPKIDDDSVVGEKDVLKVDAGVHVNGRIADAAFTLDFSGESGKLLEASQEALNNALSLLKPGLPLREIGKEIQETIEGKGFKPIKNLSGHFLGDYLIHTGFSIPNYDNRDEMALEDGMVFAIEPFASNGDGMVREGNITEIYQLAQARNCRNQDAKKIIEKVAEEYLTLPFAERWVAKELSLVRRRMAFKELIDREILRTHPVLKDKDESIVSQAETSVMIVDGEIIVLV
jgi:methionyl aminopeptidase